MADAAGQPEAGGDGSLSDADLQRLVDTVYRLFEAELRLERVRGEPLPGRTGPMGRPW
jgi:hypothetical protein